MTERNDLKRYGAAAALCAALAALPLASASAAPLAEAEAAYKEGERLYRTGDVIGAMGRLRAPADGGHAPSQVLLAEILDRAEFDEQAIAYYRKAAEQGDAAGEYGLGAMYLAGEGVKRDLRQALFWFTRSAERDYGPAVIALATAYLGDSAPPDDKPLDTATAQRWVRKAAERDHLPAVTALARAYREGGLGLARDLEQAKQWDARAADIRKKRDAIARNRKTRG